MEDLIPYLPRNPRRLKLLLRYLYSMRAQIQRFSPEDMSLARLYLCQMLRLEFPDETRRLCLDPEAIKQIEYYSATQSVKRVNQSLKGAKDPPAEDKKPGQDHAPPKSRPAERARFLDLCAAIVSVGTYGVRHSLREILTLFDHPPLVTHREAERVLEAFSAAPAEEHSRRAVIADVLSSSDGSGEPQVQFSAAEWAEKMSALVLKVVEVRQRLHAQLIELHALEDQRDFVPKVSRATELLRFLLSGRAFVTPSDNDPDRSDLLTAQSWSVFSAALLNYAHFFSHADPNNAAYLYTPLRNEDAELLILSVECMRADEQEELLPHLKLIFRDMQEHWRGNAPAPQIRDAVAGVIREAEHCSAERLLERFSQPSGMEAMWRGGTKARETQRDVAYSSKSALHTPENRQRLYAIADRAKVDLAVQLGLPPFYAPLFSLVLPPACLSRFSDSQRRANSAGVL